MPSVVIANSRELLTFTKNLVIRFVNILTALLAISEYGAPFAALVFSMAKLKLMELYIDLRALDGSAHVNEDGDGGDSGNAGDDTDGGAGDNNPPAREDAGIIAGDNGGHGLQPVFGHLNPTSGVPEVESMMNGVNGFDCVSEVKSLTSCKEITGTAKEDEDGVEAIAVSEVKMSTWCELNQQAETLRRLEQTMKNMELMSA